MDLVKIGALIAVGVAVVWAFQKTLAVQIDYEGDSVELSDERLRMLLQYQAEEDQRNLLTRGVDHDGHTFI